MTASTAAAFVAAACAVFGAWDLLGALERVRVSAWVARLVGPLARAAGDGSEPSAEERRRVAALAAGALMAAGWLLAGPGIGALAAAAGPAAGLGLIRVRRNRNHRAVRAGAAAAARAIAAGLSGGRSVRAALAEAADDVPGPAGNELHRVARALELGEPTAHALERLRARAGGGPWDTLVAAVLLQRDAGGDLAGLLRDLAASLEAAARAERDAEAATAQARFTARTVAALPSIAAALTELAAPGFLAGLLSQPLPAMMTAAAVLLQVAALLAIRRLTRTPA